MEVIFAKRLWTADGWRTNAAVYTENGRIVQVEYALPDDKPYVPILIPGMIELHAHGAVGYRAAEPNEDKNAHWLRSLAAHGVTTVLPTLSSAPAKQIHRAVAFYDRIRQHPLPDAARVAGVHLEGPFLNPEKKGGIDPRYLTLPSVEHYRILSEGHEEALRLVTLAPELTDADALIRHLTQRGVRVNAGHSNATAAEMRSAITCGLDGVTHFFNAAKPITHRDPGFLTAALLDDTVFCEMISDCIHVAPEALALLFKVAGAHRLCIVTDAVPLTGMPDGIYGDRMVVDGCPRLQNGTLCGGRCLMDGCVRALIGIGLDPWDVVCMASHTPARRIGLTDRGDVAEGLLADLAVLDDDYRILYTVIDGKRITP